MTQGLSEEFRAELRTEAHAGAITEREMRGTAVHVSSRSINDALRFISLHKITGELRCSARLPQTVRGDGATKVNAMMEERT
jgi:hypothetical protein